jgi:outer membrane protein OmpA-like peptidoglycan-associated protein/predicted  nucleic acid-binding Zn-ribbon protein
MRRPDSCAPRFSKTWLELLLGAGCLVASASDVSALSVGAGPRLHGLVLIQDRSEPAPQAAQGKITPAERVPGAAASSSFTELHEALAAARERLQELSKAAEAVAATGDLREQLETARQENRRLVAEIEALRSEDREGESARETAEARLAEASKELEAAKGQARQIDEELVAVRWQNAQLNTSLTQTRAAREEDQAKARQAQEALRAEIEALKTDDEQSGAVVARLRAQLEESERDLASASSGRQEAERQVAELRQLLRHAEQEATNAGDRLAAVEEQLSAISEQAAAARRAEQRTMALESERNELRSRVAALADQLEQTETANDRLESQVAEWREAASSATDVAQQNLRAVEQRIRELNEALGTLAPAAGPPPGARSSVGTTDAVDDGALEVAAVAVVPGENREGAAAAAGTGQPDADLAAVKVANVPRQPGEAAGSGLLSELSLEQRLQVQGLVADLNGTMDERGLRMAVPGGILFAVNSDEVQDSAHDTLAKVAELINMYGDRRVHIVGHTDALGDAAYNKTLSERRAGLVKEFFVDNFDVEEARLSTEGLGEASPIASNATQAGRRANRRIEVLILD